QTENNAEEAKFNRGLETLLNIGKGRQGNRVVPQGLQIGKRYDTLDKQMAKETLNVKETKALRFLSNALVHDGYSPSVRDLAREIGYNSPRTAHLIIERLIGRGWVKRKPDGDLQLRKDVAEQEDHARTVDVPLVGNVPCGAPILAEENIG